MASPYFSITSPPAPEKCLPLKFGCALTVVGIADGCITCLTAAESIATRIRVCVELAFLPLLLEDADDGIIWTTQMLMLRRDLGMHIQ